MSGQDAVICIAVFTTLIFAYSWVTTERFRSAQRWASIQQVVNDARDDIELAASRQRHPAGKGRPQQI